MGVNISSEEHNNNVIDSFFLHGIFVLHGMISITYYCLDETPTKTLPFYISRQDLYNLNSERLILRGSGSLIFQNGDMSERKVPSFAVQFALPLAVDVRFRDSDDVSNVQSQRRLIIGIGNWKRNTAEERS